LTSHELDAACEHLLLHKFKTETDFEVDDALDKLLEHEVVLKREDKYFALPIDVALQRLSSKLTTAVEQSFS